MPTIRSTYREGETWTTRYRVVNDDGDGYASTGISAVAVVVTDESVDPSTDLYTTTDPNPLVVFFDDYQTEGWTEDSTGYNFKHQIAPSALTTAPKGGHAYRVRYIITTNVDGVKPLDHYVTVVGGLGT